MFQDRYQVLENVFYGVPGGGKLMSCGCTTTVSRPGKPD